VIDLAVDLIFMCDMVVNFITAYEDSESGLPVTSLKKISKNYI